MACMRLLSPRSAPLFLYMPVYFAVEGASLAKAPWGDLALQAIVQGLLTAIVSLVFYGRAVSILGASSGAAFAALSPAMTAVMAIPILGEWPTAMDWIAIAGISAGVYVVSGGPLPASAELTAPSVCAVEIAGCFLIFALLSFFFVINSDPKVKSPK